MRLSPVPLLLSLLALGLLGLAMVALVVADVPQGGLTALAAWVRETQSSLQGTLVQAVRDWQALPGVASLAALTTACFLYGVFHAVGPGHGKAVISAYAATAQVRLHQVFALSALTAAVQATVAVALVAAGFLVAGSSLRWASRQATDILEPASYIAIMLVGGWLIVGGLRPLLARRQAAATVNDHDHDHDHAPDHACCGHHHPAPTAGGSRRTGVALAVAAGLRPCTGSLLVVVLCFSLGLWGLGIAASYAIGVGTAITVALLAGSVHAARGPAAAVARLARLPDGAWRHLGLTVRLVGGGLILLLGGMMLDAALSAPRHPFG